MWWHMNWLSELIQEDIVGIINLIGLSDSNVRDRGVRVRCTVIAVSNPGQAIHVCRLFVVSCTVGLETKRVLCVVHDKRN